MYCAFAKAYIVAISKPFKESLPLTNSAFRSSEKVAAIQNIASIISKFDPFTFIVSKSNSQCNILTNAPKVLKMIPKAAALMECVTLFSLGKYLPFKRCRSLFVL
jgi:hypothetical protein